MDYSNYKTTAHDVNVLQEWDTQSAAQIATELCGFVTILSGTFLLHKTKDMGDKPTEVPVYSKSSPPSQTSGSHEI